ncbi:hypothetical protein VTK73DRAFT_9891 [Phialemonium thermophilum]|uniref:Uncharacterized protein n=1 Tax=Phialemonium thermophilum TaxID=223376 RepID=A0ABR3VZJ2_9PEZI
MLLSTTSTLPFSDHLSHPGFFSVHNCCSFLAALFWLLSSAYSEARDRVGPNSGRLHQRNESAGVSDAQSGNLGHVGTVSPLPSTGPRQRHSNADSAYINGVPTARWVAVPSIHPPSSRQTRWLRQTRRNTSSSRVPTPASAGRRRRPCCNPRVPTTSGWDRGPWRRASRPSRHCRPTCPRRGARWRCCRWTSRATRRSRRPLTRSARTWGISTSS